MGKEMAFLLATDYPNGRDSTVYATLNCVAFNVEPHLVWPGSFIVSVFCRDINPGLCAH